VCIEDRFVCWQVRRKIRMSWKQLRACFRDVEDEDQRVSTANVRQILKRFDIDLTDGQFRSLKSRTLQEKTKAAQERVKWVDVLNYYREEDDY
jgi:hypothetical protein